MPSQTTIIREHFTAIMNRADLWDCEVELDGALRLRSMDTEQLLRFMIAATAVLGEETATKISGTVRLYAIPNEVRFDGLRVEAPLTGIGSVTTELGQYVATNLRGKVLRTEDQETAYEYAYSFGA